MTVLVTPESLAILQSVAGMCCLMLVMLVWMYALRLPAMNKLKIDPQTAAHPGFLATALPSHVRSVADNYNHLTEAPVVFYAIALVVVILGHADSLHARCAQAFFALRVAHSLVQATFNKVTVRFTLFILSWAALGTMIVRETATLLSMKA